MFVQNLNPAQQSALLHMAHEVAEADGVLHESQLGMMEILRGQCQESVEANKPELSELSELFSFERAKSSLILELLGVAYANREYHANEQNLINRYAVALGISPQKLAALETWVEKQIALSQEIEQLLD